MQGLPCLQQAVLCVASLPWPAVTRHVPALIDRHAWPQVVHRQRRPCRRPLPPQRCALPPSLTSALAGRALAAALAALHRVLMDAAATADLIARAAAAAALAAAAPDVAALPLCHHPRPAAFNAAALAAALAAASAAAIAAAPSTSTFSPSHCQRLHRHPHRQLPGRGRRRRPFLRMAMVLLEPVPVCGRAVLFLHVLFCGVCFVHRL